MIIDNFEVTEPEFKLWIEKTILRAGFKLTTIIVDIRSHSEVATSFVGPLPQPDYVLFSPITPPILIN